MKLTTLQVVKSLKECSTPEIEFIVRSLQAELRARTEYEKSLQKTPFNLSDEEKALLNEGKIVKAIVAFRERTKKPLKEAKDVIDSYRLNHKIPYPDCGRKAK